MLRLNANALPLLTDQTAIELPKYDRSKLECGIVHFGVGGFHRSHQAAYLDTLMGEDPGALNWAVCGVGLLERDMRMYHVLYAQDGLYTLLIKYPDGSLRARVIGALKEYLYAPDDPNQVIDRMADPKIKIVSLTITEGGYNFDPNTAEFDFSNPEVINDLEGHPQRTTFGLICSALDKRRQAGIAPFTVLSCDNIQCNGDVARMTFLAFARRKSPELAEWIVREVPFPNTMVDRITPATSNNDRQLLRDQFGLEDAWPVVCEPFTQWVVEDHFSLSRPPLEHVGVQFVDNVTPYEIMKLRLLNDSHLALGLFGYLLGYRYTHEACQDPLLVEFVKRYMRDEATPTLAPIDGVDLPAYRDELIERFSNPQIGDTLARLCSEATEKLPKWLVPVMREQLRADRSVRLCAAISAAWARYAESVDESGEPIDVVDRQRETVMEKASHNHDDPQVFISHKPWFGNLAEDPRFREPYLEALESLHKVGAHETLEMLLAKPD